MRGEADRVRTLLRDGADVNAAQGDGMTALHWTALNGDLETTNVLLVAGATADALTRVGRYTPLHLASSRGHGRGAEGRRWRGAPTLPVRYAAITLPRFSPYTGKPLPLRPVWPVENRARS